MIRNVVGAVLALVGAAAAVWSPFLVWYDGRRGRHYQIEDLFSGITAEQSELWESVLLPLAFAALVAVVGLALRTRLLVAAAGVIALGFTILWMVRQGQEAGGLSVGDDGAGLGWGVLPALGGGVLMLLAAAVMVGRPRAVGPATPVADDSPRHARHARRRGGTSPGPVPGPDDPNYPGYPPEQPPGPQRPG
ncbi:hypothetical protein [Streptomyces sp. TRM64462]|uniref:hypothetical protein n=1 Tax=Streptomyces sp. TRM64462 TaxID=2741726 RepID=UPI00158627C2|nr:hypothetical protein [Streptomyces sp. TRM64462]